MSPPVRTLHFLGDHELRSLEGLVTTVLASWAREWATDRQGDTPVHAQAPSGLACGAGELHWTEWSGAAGRIWIADPSGSAACRAVLGVSCDGTALDNWLRSALAQAMADRDRRLAEALVGDVVSTTRRLPAESLAVFGSGAVRWDCPGHDLVVIADDSVLRHVPPRDRAAVDRPALSPLVAAAQHAPVRLTVGLGSVELDVARLLELQPGDVLRLPTCLSERLPLTIDGVQVGQGALGQFGRRKAVQVLAL